MLSILSWHVYPRLGPITPHGIGIAVGFFLGGSLMARYAQRKGISSDHVWNMLMRAVFGVIVGARLFYVIGHFSSYWPNLLDIFEVWEGGLVFYGGVFGGIAAAYPYARKHRLAFWDVLDAAAPGFPLGLIFGRIGDLIVGDHLGGPSTLPFAFRASGGNPVSVPVDLSCLPPSAGGVGAGALGCHQTALYDLANVLVLLPLVLLLMRRERGRGFVIAFTATAYGIGRFFVDFARSGTATYAGLRGTQWISLALILFGIWYTLRRGRLAVPAAAGGEAQITIELGEERLADESAPADPAAPALDIAPEDAPSEATPSPATRSETAAPEDDAPSQADPSEREPG